MAGRSANIDLRNQLNTLTHLGAAGDLSDGQLLHRFLTVLDSSSDAAFTALVERHGPMVLRVCYQILGDRHNAEDAFQATFMVLARKAGSVHKADSVASWLHGVARRVALRAKADAARRRVYERRGVAMKAEGSRREWGQSESWPELHEEIARLPERYREPVVLCYLEGLTTEAAAARIGCPQGTILSRISRARERLRERLTRHSLALPAVLLAAGLLPEAGAVAVPAALLKATVRASLGTVGRKAIAGALAPTTAVALARGVLYAMMISKLKFLGAATLACVLALGGMQTFARQFGGRKPTTALDPVASKAADPRKSLAEGQLRLARQALQDLESLLKRDAVSPIDPRFSLWERRQLEALRASGAGKEELVKSLENYVKRMKDQVQRTEQLYKRDGSPRVDMLDIQYRALEAEMWLNQEKAR